MLSFRRPSQCGTTKTVRLPLTPALVIFDDLFTASLTRASVDSTATALTGRRSARTSFDSGTDSLVSAANEGLLDEPAYNMSISSNVGLVIRIELKDRLIVQRLIDVHPHTEVILHRDVEDSDLIFLQQGTDHRVDDLLHFVIR